MPLFDMLSEVVLADSGEVTGGYRTCMIIKTKSMTRFDMTIEVRAKGETSVALSASMRFRMDMEMSTFVVQYDNLVNSVKNCALTSISPGP